MRQRGFTLLEVLVALVIAGLAIGALLQGALGGLQSARIAGHYDEALSRARSRLAILSHGAPVAPGVLQGDDGGGFLWRTQVSALAMLPGSPGQATRPALYAVAVTIAWRMDGPERSVRLDSQVLATAPAAR